MCIRDSTKFVLTLAFYSDIIKQYNKTNLTPFDPLDKVVAQNIGALLFTDSHAVCSGEVKSAHSMINRKGRRENHGVKTDPPSSNTSDSICA